MGAVTASHDDDPSPILLSEITTDADATGREATGIPELDRVLGGGLVPVALFC